MGISNSNRSSRSSSKHHTKDYENTWSNLLNKDEKNFSCHEDYVILRKKVIDVINDKKDIKKSIFEVEFLYRKQINKNKLTGLVSYPSILALISGALVIYSLICQASSHTIYEFAKDSKNCVFKISESNLNNIIFLLVVLISLILIAVYLGCNAFNKDKNNLFYYDQILKILNEAKNKDSEKESIAFLRSWSNSKRLITNEKKLAKEIREFLNTSDSDSDILINYLRKIKRIYENYLKDASGTEKFNATPNIEIQFYNSYIVYIQTLIDNESMITTEK